MKIIQVYETIDDTYPVSFGGNHFSQPLYIHMQYTAFIY